MDVVAAGEKGESKAALEADSPVVPLGKAGKADAAEEMVPVAMALAAVASPAVAWMGWESTALGAVVERALAMGMVATAATLAEEGEGREVKVEAAMATVMAIAVAMLEVVMRVAAVVATSEAALEEVE